jgi:hypothetical protein
MVVESAAGKRRARSRNRDQGRLRLASRARSADEVTQIRIDRPSPAWRDRKCIRINGSQERLELRIRPGNARYRLSAQVIRIES